MDNRHKILRKPLPTGCNYTTLRQSSTRLEGDKACESDQDSLPLAEFQQFISSRFFAADPKYSQMLLSPLPDSTGHGTADAESHNLESQIELHAKPQDKEQCVRSLKDHIDFDLDQSFWVARPFLITFGTFLFVMILVLTMLYGITKQSQGFSLNTEKSTFSYLWRYGPVALFTVFAALWKQTDYHIKVAVPWQYLEVSEKSFWKSIQHDYISPWLPVALYTAIQDREWMIVISSGVYSALKVIIVFSTGLFVVQDIDFVGEKQDISLTWASHSLIPKKPEYIINPGPLNTFWGVVSAGLDYPRGTSASAAFQTFGLNETFQTNAQVSAEVDAMFPTFDCELAQTESLASTVFRSWTEDCPALDNITTYYCGTYFGTGGCQNYSDVLTTTLHMNLSPVFCGGWLADFNEGDDQNLQYSVTMIETQTDKTGPISAKVIRSLFCKSSYNIERASLLLDTSSPINSHSFHLSGPLTASKRIFESMSPSKLAHRVADMVTTGYSFTGLYRSGDIGQLPDRFAYLMLATVNQTDLSIFRDQDEMTKAAQATFNGILIQTANQQVVPNSTWMTDASVKYTLPRLRLQSVALWILCSLLLFTVVCVYALDLIGRRKVIQKAFGSHLWNVYCFCHSQRIRDHLDSLKEVSAKSVNPRSVTDKSSDLLSRTRVSTLKGHLPRKSLEGAGSRLEQDVWSPLGLRSETVFALVIIVLAAILSLELIQRKSEVQGFASVSVSNTTAQFLSTYLPAVFFLSITAILNCLEFDVKAIAPFQNRKDINDLTGCSIAVSVFSLNPILLYKSIRWRQYAIVLAVCHGTLAGFFTIVSSGLYTISNISSTHETTLNTSGSFDLVRTDRISRESNLLAGLSTYLNASYSPGTYAEFVLPDIDFATADSKTKQVLNQSSSILKVQSDVLRPSLTCIEVPASRISTVLYSSSVHVMTTGNVSSRCRQKYFQNYTRYIVGTNRGTQSADISYSGWAGAIAYDSGSNTSAYEPVLSNDTTIYFVDGCPSWGLIWGRWTNTSVSLTRRPNDSKFAMYTCSQYIESIPAVIDMSITNRIAMSNTSPKLDESRARTVSTYQFDPMYLGQDPGFWSPFECEITDNLIFAAVICGKDSKLRKEDLGDPSKQEEVLKEVIRVYGIIMAQEINRFMRQGSYPSILDWPRQVNVTIQSQDSFRIFQNKTPKIVLQVLLAITLVCFVGAHILTHRKSLSHDPMTVAGSMSLLSGSRACDELQDKVSSFKDFKRRVSFIYSEKRQ